MLNFNDWVFVELGGSSSQTITLDNKGRFSFASGVSHTTKKVALACPGLIKGNKVYYATNLGWPDIADPKQELNLENIEIIENDVVAAALGESVLRSKDNAIVDLYYISLGTGVGSGYVENGEAHDLDLGHMHVGGKNYCEGCRNIGCLNSEIESKRLPKSLHSEDLAYIAKTLSEAIIIKNLKPETILVLGGGIVKKHPKIVHLLNDLIPNTTEITVAPEEAKSSAFAGLLQLVKK